MAADRWAIRRWVAAYERRSSSNSKPASTRRARTYGSTQACQCPAAKGIEWQRTLLDQSLAAQSTDIEALIELYKTTGGRRQAAARSRALSKEFIEKCREHIDDEPENPTYYNQIAWLIANTEGNKAEGPSSFRKSRSSWRSRKAIRRRGWAACTTRWHTLIFAEGGPRRGHRLQEEALRLDPHTRSIRRGVRRVSRGAGQGGGRESERVLINWPHPSPRGFGDSARHT